MDREISLNKNMLASMDIKNAYGVDFINKAERSFDFENDKITLTDKFDFTNFFTN